MSKDIEKPAQKGYKEVLAATIKAAAGLQKNTKELQRVRDLVEKEAKVNVAFTQDNE